jgi:hypothetical protein
VPQPSARAAEFHDLVDATWAAASELRQIRVALTGDENDPTAPSILAGLESIAQQLDRLAAAVPGGASPSP